MTGGTAVERNLRILATATGFGSMIFTLLSASAMLEEAPYVRPAVYIPFTVLFNVLPMLLAPLGRWASVRTIRTVAGAHTVITALFLALWGAATVSVPLIGDRGPWLLGMVATAAAAAAIAWPPVVVWCYVALLAISSGVLRYVTEGAGDVLLAVQDAVSVATFCMFIAALLMVTVRAGREQDAALAVALADARSAAEAESRAHQRARFGSFVHDDVITTLLAAVGALVTAPAIGDSARRALGRLDAFVAAGSRDGRLTIGSFDIELRAAASEIVDGVQFTGSLDAYTGVIPAAAAVAITGALGEAIRNSLRHGGVPGVPIVRRVHVSATAHGITVEASDNGRGFDPRRIAPERLGIRTSILGRMSAVPGCSAQILSDTGRGTRVLLGWSAA